jgi:uncharacterized membrane protein YeaQ/YmgE (transglycosylase-associated protein family)
MSILWFILIGIVAGWLAGLLMRGHGFGMIGDLVLGIVGAVIGGFIFDLLGVTAYGTTGSIAMSVIGAVVLLGITGMFRRA